MRRFEKNVAELKAAGATLVDPIVIPNLKKLLATRERNPVETDAALELYLARNPYSPFKTREPTSSTRPTSTRASAAERRALQGALAALQPGPLCRIHAAPASELMINIAKVMADNKLDAIVHKSVEHQPTPDQERHQSALRDARAACRH